jgi:uncharacterized protein YeaO (DUF488 family)
VTIRTKRVYEEPTGSDGQRVLVDRLWPRGISRDRARLDEWLRDVAPSNELRRWYHQHSERWEEFTRRYRLELEQRHDEVGLLLERARRGTLTLLYSSKETEHNNATALKAYLEGKLR